MAAQPTFLDTAEGDLHKPTSNGCGSDADRAASHAEWARASAQGAQHSAKVAQSYREEAKLGADRAEINASGAGLSAGTARIAADSANTSADTGFRVAEQARTDANRAAQSAAHVRHIAYALLSLGIGLILGFMLAALLYVWVVRVVRDVTPPLPPSYTQYDGGTSGQPPAGTPNGPHHWPPTRPQP